MKPISFISFFLFLLFFLSQTACNEKECPQSCQHGGTCQKGICNCAEGYAGVNCEIKLDPCYVLGCDTLHSSCDTTGSTPFCVCDEGWEGENCDKTWLEKYIGSYNASEVCGGVGNNFTIEAVYAPKELAFALKYFHDTLSGGVPAKVVADLHGANNFLITPQYMSFGLVSGSGEFYPSTKSMLIYFSLIRTGSGSPDTTNCELTLERQ